MGEARYYMKARVTKEKMTEIRKFISQGQKAFEWWQDHRDENPGVFWSQFKKKFPLITKYLRTCKSGYPVSKFIDESSCDCDNNLVGLIEFGYDDKPQWSKGVMLFSAEVWHFADWDYFANFLVSHFGVKKVDWVSGKYVDIFEILKV